MLYREKKKGKNGISDLCLVQRRKKGKVAFLSFAMYSDEKKGKLAFGGCLCREMKNLIRGVLPKI